MMDLDHEIAEAFFGWKWMAFDGIPVRDAPGYPDRQRVRQFFPPEVFSNEQWKLHFAKTNAAPALGTEPLSYRYCSSRGPHYVPHFSGDENACRELLREVKKMGKWTDYMELLASEYGSDPATALFGASCDLRCRIALQFKPDNLSH